MNNWRVLNNDYYVSLGERLKRKSEEFRHTVDLNASDDKISQEASLEMKRAYKMKLIHPNQIVARGENKSVMEVLQK